MVRNLCRATVGELLWLRGVLPPADFDETAFGGVTTHLPRPGTPIADWLEDGVFVALEGGESCPRCGSRISQLTANQRITSYCRSCQPGMLIGNR